eukprot:656390-Pelagomonas_calceolata.AAC.2
MIELLGCQHLNKPMKGKDWVDVYQQAFLAFPALRTTYRNGGSLGWSKKSWKHAVFFGTNLVVTPEICEKSRPPDSALSTKKQMHVQPVPSGGVPWARGGQAGKGRTVSKSMSRRKPLKGGSPGKGRGWIAQSKKHFALLQRNLMRNAPYCVNLCFVCPLDTAQLPLKSFPSRLHAGGVKRNFLIGGA